LYIGFKTVLNGFCCAGTSSCGTFIHTQKKEWSCQTMTFSPGQNLVGGGGINLLFFAQKNQEDKRTRCWA
jgi:hypothetical protein